MSDSTDPSSAAIGAAVAGFIGLLIAFVRALFVRNVGAAEKKLDELVIELRAVSSEVRSMHDEQLRQRSDFTMLTDKIAEVKLALKAAHERIDALITPAPRRSK